MKQKIALLFTALFLFGFTQAQVSKKSYEKAVDFLNCKTVELSLKDDKNLFEFQNKCPCGTTNYTQIIQFLTSVKLDATISLSNEVEGLKKIFKKNWKKTDAVTFLSESVFSDKTKYQKISSFADRRKGKLEFDNYKASLKADIGSTLLESAPIEAVPQTNSQTNVTIPEPSFDDRITELENKINTKREDKGILGGASDYLIIFSILLSAIALFLGFRKQSGNDYEMTNEIKNYIRKKIDETNWNRSTPNNNVGSADLRDANNRIRDLETQIEKIKSQLFNLNPVSNYTAQTTQPTSQEIKQPEVISQTFFLSTPNSDGSFNESSSSSTYKDGATIYRFTKIGSNRAKFQIDEKDASARLALQYPDKNIDPVCDAVNAFNPKATRITTVDQGEAELQNGKWVVDRNKKAKIKYEN
jgi:hypothetical protein